MQPMHAARSKTESGFFAKFSGISTFSEVDPCKEVVARRELSALGAPLPRGLACVTVDAGPHRCRLAFFLDVVAAISDEGPGMAIGDHVGPKVAAINVTNRDRAAVAIDAPGFAGDVAFANQCAQVFGGSLPSRPSIGARLARTGSFIGLG